MDLRKLKFSGIKQWIKTKKEEQENNFPFGSFPRWNKSDIRFLKILKEGNWLHQFEIEIEVVGKSICTYLIEVEKFVEFAHLYRGHHINRYMLVSGRVKIGNLSERNVLNQLKKIIEKFQRTYKSFVLV